MWVGGKEERVEVGDAGGGVWVEAGFVKSATAGGAGAKAEALVRVAGVVGGVAGAVMRGFVLGGLKIVREKAYASVREVDSRESKSKAIVSKEGFGESDRVERKGCSQA